jgi:hypothetical protein
LSAVLCFDAVLRDARYTRFEPELHPALLKEFQAIIREPFAHLVHYPVAGIDHHYLHLARFYVPVEPPARGDVIVELRRDLYAGVSAAGDDEGEKLSPRIRVGFEVGPLEHIYHVVSENHRVVKRL